MDYKWTALTVTFVGTLMAGIDARIVVIGLPTIAHQLQAGADKVIWITQGYILAGTVGLLLVGRVADLFGRIKLYNLGFVIFTIGSLFSSLSSNADEVIVFRVVQGVGAGILVTISSTIITDAAPRTELGKMLGLNQMAWRVGNMTGLTLSGILLAVVDWRGLFYINVPIGIFGAIWARKRLREIGVRDVSKKIDWAGFIFFSSGLSLILVALTYLSYGLSGYPVGYGLLAAGLVLLVLFIIAETKSNFPLLDLKLLKIRLFAMGNIAQAMNSLSWGGLILLVAFYLQIGLGFSALAAGLGVLPLELTYLVSTYASGRLADKYGSRGLTSFGLSIIAACLLAMWTFGPSTSYGEVALVLAVIGVGNGMFTSPNLWAIMSSVPLNRIGIASSFRNTMFQIGITTSYGLVILLVTFGIPYGALSQLLEGTGRDQATILLERLQFIDGFRIAVFVLAVIQILAIVPSAMRGPQGRIQIDNVPSPERESE